MGTLSINKKLPCRFFRGPTPFLVANIGAIKELHYALVDTASQVNILSERLANQLSLPIKGGSPLELYNGRRTAININRVCGDVIISTVGKSSLQIFLVTSTVGNDFLLYWTWLLFLGARMNIAGKGQNARVAVTVTLEDGTESSVKAVFCDDFVRTPALLVSKT